MEKSDVVAKATVSELIGFNVRRRRERLGWSQTELGRQLGRFLGTEWTRQQVFTAEKGIRVFTATEIVGLAMVLGTLPGVLFEPDPTLAQIVVINLADGISIDSGWLSTGAGPSGAVAEALRDIDLALGELSQTSSQIGALTDHASELQGRLNDAARRLREHGGRVGP